jgi:hypothetical protein
MIHFITSFFAQRNQTYECVCNKKGWLVATLSIRYLIDYCKSKRSKFITLVHALTKSFTNFSFASALA